MKIRTGFISNSSSSSFIVCSKERFEDAIEHEFEEIFNIPTIDRIADAPFKDRFIHELKWDICQSLSDTDTSYYDFKNWEEIEKSSEIDTRWWEENEKNEIKRLFADGWNYVSFLDIPNRGDGGSALQSALMFAMYNFQNKNIKFIKDE